MATGKREAALIGKIRDLSPAQVAEVEDFIDFLRQRERERWAATAAATKLSERAFARVWDNPADEDYDKL